MKKRLPQIYVTDNGVTRRVSAKEAKAHIMREFGWTSDQYTKQRDILKNRLRNFESFQRQQGKAVKPQNVVELLYKTATSKHRYGSQYKPSQQWERIQSFSAVSITKGRQAAARQGRVFAKINARQLAYIDSRFGGLIAANKGAAAIKDAFVEDAEKKGTAINATKLEAALSDYANMIHEKIDKPKGTNADVEAIPSGESQGSPDDISGFDIEDYL